MTAAIPGEGFRIATGFLEVVADDRKARRDTDSFIRDTRRKMATGGRQSGNSFGDGLVKGLFPHLRRIAVGIADMFRQALMGMAKLTAFGLIGGAIASAVAGIGSAIASLVPAIGELGHVAILAAGSLLLLPGALITVVAALATAIIGFRGFGTAVKAALGDDAEAAEKALAKLAPSMAATVRAVVALKPAVDKLRLNVQQNLFAKWADSVKSLGSTWLPMLTVSLGAVASALGDAVAGAVAFITGKGAVADWDAIFNSAAKALGNLGRAFAPLLRIVTDVTAVSTQLFAQYTGGAAAAMTRWADSIADMRADGSLAKLITDGIDALKQFGALAMDIVGIFRGIFTASGTGGLFSFFDRLNKLINSATGQTALKSIFDSLEQAGVALTPVLVALLQALVPVANGLAQISIAFGPGLTVLATALGQALAMLAPGIVSLTPLLAVLASGLAPVAEILSELVATFAPGATAFLTELVKALGPLADVAPIVGTALADLFIAIAPLLGPLGEVLAAALTGISVGLAGLAQFLTPALSVAANYLTKAFEMMSPRMTALATSILPDLVEAGMLFAGVFGQVIIDKLPQLIELSGKFVDILERFVNESGERFAQSISNIIPMLPMLVQSFIDLAGVSTQFLTALLPFMPLLETLISPVGIMVLTSLIYFLAAELAVTTQQLQLVGAAFQWVKDRVKELVDWIGSLGATTQNAIGAAMNYLQAFGVMIGNTASNFGSLLYNAGRNLITGLINGIRDAIPGLTAVLGWITSKLPDWKGPLDLDLRILKPAGQATMTGFMAGIQSQIPRVRDSLADVTAGLPAMAAAGSGGMSFTQGPTHVTVMIGNRVIDDAVEQVLVSRPDMVASATDEGHRQIGFTSTRNRLVARR